MQRLRRLSVSSSTPDSVNPPQGSGALHRSATATGLSAQRTPRSPSSPFDAPLRRTPSSHLLSGLVAPAPATTAVCTGVPAEATVVRAPALTFSGEAGALPHLTPSAYGIPGASSRTRGRQPSTAPIPISPTSPSAHAHRRESALAEAIRSGDAGALRAERRRTELVDARFLRGAAGEASDEGSASGESYEVEIVDTRGAGGGLVRAMSGSRRASIDPTATRRGSGASAGGGLIKPVPKYTSGRRLSCLATYEGLPMPPQLRSPHSAGIQEPELNYSLHGLRPGANGGGGGGGGSERPRVRTVSSSAPPPPSPMHRPPSPVPDAFRSSVSPLTRTSGITPRRPSSPGPGISSSSIARRDSLSAGLRRSGVVVGASPSSAASGGGSVFGSVRRASSPAPVARSGSLVSSAGTGITPSPRPSHARAPSPARTSGAPRVVHGFDAPARAPSPSRSFATASPTPLGRRPSAHSSTHVSGNGQGHGHSHAAPPRPSSPSPAPSSEITRPRSRLADSHADERLEVLASRDFAVLDAYYSSRRGGNGERRAVKREVEERLRRGYDRASGGTARAAGV